MISTIQKVKSASQELVSSSPRKTWWMASWLLQNVHCPPFSGGRSGYDMMVPHIDMAVGDTFKMSSKSHSPFLLHEPNHLLNDCRKTPVGLRRHLRSSRNSWRQKKRLRFPACPDRGAWPMGLPMEPIDPMACHNLQILELKKCCCFSFGDGLRIWDLFNSILVGGWATPLKNMKVNWDDYSQYFWENKIHVPNHQPVLRCSLKMG